MQYRDIHNHNISVLTYDRRTVRTPDLRSNGLQLWFREVTPADASGPSEAPSRFVREPIFLLGVHCGRIATTSNRDSAKAGQRNTTMGALHRSVAKVVHTRRDQCGSVRGVKSRRDGIRCALIHRRVHAINGRVVGVPSLRQRKGCVEKAVLPEWETSSSKQMAVKLTDNVLEIVLKRLSFHFSSLKGHARYLFKRALLWRVRWWFG